MAELERRGHEALAVRLPAEDDAAGWNEYADAVATALGDRQPVVLVAQSLAGFTAPLVAARRPVALIVLLNAMVPRPLHSGQVSSDAPGAAPLPLQVSHGSVTGSVTGTLPPSAATRNGTSTTASRVSPRGSSRRPLPKIDEKMSPRPKLPRSPNSMSSVW